MPARPAGLEASASVTIAPSVPVRPRDSASGRSTGSVLSPSQALLVSDGRLPSLIGIFRRRPCGWAMTLGPGPGPTGGSGVSEGGGRVADGGSPGGMRTISTPRSAITTKLDAVAGLDRWENDGRGCSQPVFMAAATRTRQAIELTACWRTLWRLPALKASEDIALFP